MNLRSNRRGSVTRERRKPRDSHERCRSRHFSIRSCGRQQEARSVQRLVWSVSLFPMSDEQKDKTPQSAAVLWARYSQIAFIIPAAVVMGLLVGKLLDYWFHTHWLFLAGVIVGAIAGFVELIRTVTRDKSLKG